MVNAFLEIHIFFVFALFFLPLHNLYWLYNEGNFIKLARKVRFYAPMHHFFLSAVIFSGIVLAFYTHNFFSIRQLLMYLLALYLLISEIKRYKKIRVIGSKELTLQERFILFAKRKYSLDTVILGVFIAIFIS